MSEPSCCEYEWNEDAPIGRYPVKWLRCNADVPRLVAELQELRAAAREVLEHFWDNDANTREPGRVALEALLLAGES